jgi:hypothetical protein
MTYRGTTNTSLDVIRDLIDEVNELKRQIGSVKQNTIRLGDWVLEAVDDSLVKMTNLVTGEESFIGGVGGGGQTVINQTVVQDFPPFVVGGVVRMSFNNPIKTNVYVVPYDVAISKILTTVAVTATGAGLQYRIYQNGVVVHTSPNITANFTETAVSLAFAEGDVVYMEVFQINGNSDEDILGLTVMLRS